MCNDISSVADLRNESSLDGSVTDAVVDQSNVALKYNAAESCDGMSGTTAMSSLSAVAKSSITSYRNAVTDNDFLLKVKDDCERRIEDVRQTNESAQTLSAFLAIPAVIGYFAKLSCSRNADFLYRNGKRPSVGTSFSEADYKNYAGQIDGASYLEFVNRFLLKKQSSTDWKKDNGVAKVLYGMLRCGLLHGQTLLFNRELKESSYCTNSATSVDTQKNCLGQVTCKITHNKNYAKTLSMLESKIQAAAGSAVDLEFCANTLCDEIMQGVGIMFTEAANDPKLKHAIIQTFELEPPICFVDFDAELKNQQKTGSNAG